MEVIDNTPRCRACDGSIHPCYQYMGDTLCENCWVENIAKRMGTNKPKWHSLQAATVEKKAA